VAQHDIGIPFAEYDAEPAARAEQAERPAELHLAHHVDGYTCRAQLVFQSAAEAECKGMLAGRFSERDQHPLDSAEQVAAVGV